MPEKNLREAQRLEEMYGLPVDQALAAMNMADTDFQAGVAPYLPPGSEIDPEAMSFFGADPKEYRNLPRGLYRGQLVPKRGVSSRLIDNPMQNDYFPVERGGIAIFGADNANPQVISHEYRHMLGLDQDKNSFFPNFDEREETNLILDLLASRTKGDFEDASKMVGGLEGIETLMEQEGVVIGPSFTTKNLPFYPPDEKIQPEMLIENLPFYPPEEGFDVQKLRKLLPNVPRGTSEEGIGELMNKPRPRTADLDSRLNAATAALMREAGLPVKTEQDAADLEPEILEQFNAIMDRSTEE